MNTHALLPTSSGKVDAAVQRRHPERLRAELVAGGTLSAGVLAVVIFIVWGTLGAGYAAVLPYPLMEAIRNIRWGELLSRFDLLFVPLWLGLIALKLAIWVIVAAQASRRAVRMGQARLWYIAVVGATLIPAVMGFPTVSGRIAFLKNTHGVTARSHCLVLSSPSAALHLDGGEQAHDDPDCKTHYGGCIRSRIHDWLVRVLGYVSPRSFARPRADGHRLACPRI